MRYIFRGDASGSGGQEEPEMIAYNCKFMVFDKFNMPVQPKEKF